MLKVGVIGTGIMARQHAQIVDAYHRSELLAWGSRGTPTDLPVEAPVMTADALLALDELDAVIIATPDFAHAELAVRAAAAGKHVLIEKPLATTADDARRIRDAARDAGVVATTLFNHRWVPAYSQARALSRDSQLGAPVLAYARKNDTIYVPTEMIDWADRTTPSFFLSSHDLDLVLWCFQDRVVEVYATAVWGVLRDRGVETPDAVHAQLKLAGGGVITLEACWILPNTFPTMTDSFIELIFTEGTIRLDRVTEQIEIATNDAFRYPRNQLLSNIDGKLTGSVAMAIHDFIDAVVDDRPALVTVDSSVHVTEVLVAIDESCRTGQPVRMIGTASS
ncbi:Gfo/Idh/MocA family protein [Microcella sp.]|uniref:Gfo/Idh/MocA family protein n=1 Tax=Microcella sp. TaxID=1913979 RepID=UPI00256A662C|nr:Gfo/Idh/MocA family oxidoreductase [Microcella sp.]MBX9471929.1 Gfo/Idh/MocA family oxidoreductase [Microcella sp.]